MHRVFTMAAILGTFLAVFGARPALAGQFSSVNDCRVGKRVALNNGQHGKITRIDRPWSYCYVLLDDTGKEVSFLYSLLSDEGGAAKKDDGKLIVGKYMCWVGSEGTGDMRITGPSTYETDGKKGTYHVEASGKIVFESGPFASFHAKVLDSHRIGLNLSGGTFYNMTCDPPR